MKAMSAVGALLSCLFLAACGGGGGGSGSSSSSSSSSGGGSGNTITLDRTRVDLVADDPLGANTSVDVTVTFSGAGVAVGTLPGETLPAWLTVFNPTVVNSTSARVRLQMNAQASGTPQRFTTTLRFATADASGGHIAFRDLTVTGTIDHTLSPAVGNFIYTRGATTTPAMSADVQTLNATWTASSDVAWLSVSPASGTGNATLNLTTTPAALAEGDYVGTITVRDTLTMRTRTTTIYLGVDPRRLETDRRGLSFSSTLGPSRLTRSLRVIDTAGLNGRWTAASDAAWLTSSSPGGTGSGTLTLTANPTGLTEGMHYATVTLAPDNEPGLANSTTVRAGFFVDRTHAIASPVAFTGEHGFTIESADPIRPYFYNITSSPTPTLNVWNMYTGALVDTLPAVFGGPPAISPDGSLLLVLDPGTHTITPIHLTDDTRTAGTPWAGMRFSVGIDRLAFTRINGSDVVVMGSGQLLSATTGGFLADFSASAFLHPDTPRFVAASPDGRAAYLAGESIANHRLLRFALGYRAGAYTARLTHDFNEPGDGNPPTVDPTSTYLYSGGDRLTRYDATTMAVQRTAVRTGGGVNTVLENGDVFASVYAGPLVRLDRDLNEIAFGDFGNVHLESGRISSDERRIFTTRTGAGLELRDLP